MAKSIYDVLKADHKRFREIGKQILNTNHGAVKTREKLLHELKHLVKVHGDAEEKHFYPLLMEHDRDKMLESIHEHRLVGNLFDELENIPYGEEKWLAKFKVAFENLTHHIEEEEKETFKMAHKVMRKIQEQALGDDVEDYENKRRD